MNSEFTIENAPSPPPRRGRPAGFDQHAIKAPLVRQLEQVRPGQVLRWRSSQASHSRANNAIYTVRTKIPSAAFSVRKEDGGLDIYRIA